MTSPISDALAELGRQFAEQLPTRLDAIRAHFQQLDRAAWLPTEAEKLHRLLHSLTGSAGTFGMQSVSDVACALGIRLAALLKTGAAPTEAEWQTISSEMSRLDQLARIRLESSAPSLKPPPAPQRLNRSPLIHLVEDDPAQAEHLSQVLRDDGYRVRVFSNSTEFRAVCIASNTNTDTERPAAVVMDMILPEGDTAGAALLMELKAGKERCPPVVFASVRDDLPARLAAFRAGASRYLVKPVQPDHLIDLLDSLTGRQPAQPYRVLMVDDDPLLLEAQAAMLRSVGMEVHALSQPLQIMEVLNNFAPDVVVLDVYMPEASGLELAAVLRERDEQLHLPILFLSAETDITQQLLALNLGGDDFLVKPVQPDHLISAVTARARRARQNSTIRQRLETTRYEREREHLALDHHAIVSVADQAGNITYANDKFCEISGYSRNELLGQNHRLLKSGEHPPEFYQNLWSTIASGKVWQGKICNRRKDGSPYWVASTITPFLDSDGKPYQYVSIRTDITEQQLAVNELRQTKNLLDSIVENIPVMVFLKRANELTFELFNRAGENLLGYSRNDLLGKGNYDLWPKEQGDWFTAADRKVLASTEITEIPEEPIQTANGETRYLHTWKVALRNEGGEATHLLGISVDITDIKLAKQAAEAHKERLRRGQLFANIGTWDWNIQSGELFWTERIAPLFGYHVGELETSYENFLAAIHPDDRQSVIDAVNASVERDAPYEIEHRVVWPDGTERWLLERGAVLRDAEGKPLQMLGVVQDIDDRKRAEMSLVEREKELREAQTLARIGNWVADIINDKLTWSDEIYRIFGHEPSSCTPSIEAFHAAVHPDDRERVRESEKLAAQTGHHDVVHRILRPDGTIRHVHELAQAETDAAGNLIRLTGTVQDITERVEAEMKLRESQEKLNGLFQLSPLGIALTDQEGHYLEFNEAFRTICGYPADELKNLDYWTLTPREHEQQEAEQLESLRKTGRYGPYEKNYRQKDGRLVPIRLNGTLVKGQDGQPQIWSIVEDITDGKKAEQALIAAREEADRANQAKSEFLSSMSHELRTPMNAILGFGQLMEYDEALSDEHKDNVREILKAGHHLLELINEVLDLAKVESGHIDLSLEPVEVCSIIDECRSLISHLAEKRDIQLSHKELKGAAVRADRTRLRQVLLNLLSNAIKYNRDGGTVRIDVKPEGSDRLRILVTDTGLGIPAERLTELFQPFNRLDAENSGIEGTGIGLTITRRIIEMMGGTVDVESNIGVGSTFWIELPLEFPPNPDRQASIADSATPSQRIEAAQHTVLYIEDNPSNLRLVAQILGRRQHIHLLTAHTPELGIELAMARRPELILLDINMPGMDGYQVLEVFKADDRLKSIPVIAITANAMPRDIERGKAAGFAAYVTKPIDMTEFFSALDRCLPDRKENQA
ncbi:MAG: PAS domain S-box protein [Gammaproteobacteria bacterium]|nr:PAS domain S-box protein [Gammaproteobacteria bacterium]MBU1979710.1 PAS domain S-box protein [Gammaproteobacteria bacterium]